MHHGERPAKPGTRTGCTICGAQCQMEMQDPMFKDYYKFQDSNTKVFKCESILSTGIGLTSLIAFPWSQLCQESNTLFSINSDNMS